IEPAERPNYIPGVDDKLHFGVRLEEVDGTWNLTMKAGDAVHSVRMGEQIRYTGRATLVEQDWLDMPVSAISFKEATAYVNWLDRSGRMPGARLCTEYEWERAARGADGRNFPH